MRAAFSGSVVRGYLTPGLWIVPVQSNLTSSLAVVYGRAADFSNRVNGSARGRYVVHGLTSLNEFRHLTNAPWLPIITNTMCDNGRHIFTNEQGSPYQFFRTTYLTNQ